MLTSTGDEPAVPHVTRDFKTATKHSKPCLLSCDSDRPKDAVSNDPGTDRAVTLREGGIAVLCEALVVGGREGLKGSPALCDA